MALRDQTLLAQPGEQLYAINASIDGEVLTIASAIPLQDDGQGVASADDQ
jgi:hypothetical protein